MVQAELVHDLGGGEGVVRIDGRLFRALYPEGLPQGARVALRLVESGPPLTFQLAEPADSALTRLLHPPGRGLGSAVAALLAPGEGAGPAGGELAAAARWLDLPLEPGALARALARWVQGAGLFHEAALARGEVPEDLKSALLRLVARLPEGSAVREAADALLGHLSAHQARSALEGVPVFPLVLPWGEEPIQGELRLEGEGGGRKSEGPRWLRLRLQMPQLGVVELRVRWGEAGVSVRLAVEPAILELTRAHLTELDGLLRRRAGVRVAELRADPLPPPEPRTGRSLVEVLA